jgi:hypothetical protein
MTSLGALRAYSAQRTLQPIMRSTPTGRWWNPLTGVIDTVEWDGTRGAPALAAASQLSSGFPVMTTEPASGTTKLFVGNYEISCEL